MQLSDLDKLEDMHPELRFYMIDVPSPKYHGHIHGRDIYINENQPDWDWVLTACHEIAHSENDSGDCSNTKRIKTLRAEKWAVCESKIMYKKLGAKITIQNRLI